MQRSPNPGTPDDATDPQVLTIPHRRVVGTLTALVVALIAPAQAHAQPPTQCLTNIPSSGKQVYIPCDLLNARVNYPPGQRCQGLPINQYPKDVREWCG